MSKYYGITNKDEVVFIGYFESDSDAYIFTEYDDSCARVNFRYIMSIDKMKELNAKFMELINET